MRTIFESPMGCYIESATNQSVTVQIPVVEKDGKYYLRAGKRRLIAAKKADLKKVSVKVEE